MKLSLPDIVSETTGSELAALRVKNATAKLERGVREVFSNAIRNLAAEGVKRLLGM